ncbi:MAG: 2-oxoglutarate ferredoxin oxidoreductase subunit alpha [Rhodospirillaceae bacterium]|nr:2-oxoglutarate ferredoxin oxidoreductase subunit alpha [Rhodospirillaceae bacterium]|tara:strand:- start:6894 stop:8771 length:1878 start_codon:yes stop_codon:yes gene_type:complete
MPGNAVLTQTNEQRESLDSVVVRFAGDSGDGIQLTGGRFTDETAVAGNDLVTFPDFPAEIRAPIGTTYGVSAFQIQFGSNVVKTSGDSPDVLVCMNPAALKVNLEDLKVGGVIISDIGTFNDKNIEKAGFAENPLEGSFLDAYRRIDIDISKLTLESVKDSGVNKRDGQRCKNMWTLGLVSWMYDRDIEPTVQWLESKFKNLPEIAKANISALKAGHAFGETAELPAALPVFTVGSAEFKPGEYRTVTGTEALAWGLTVGSNLANLKLLLASYPITPASSLLHVLSGLKEYNVSTFQAEDEIAAVCAAIGASYGGAMGITSSSGPGVALKTEALGLAIAAELPLILVNSQRAGPSTGMPTKTEQSDLYLAVYGRNADAPLVVLAPQSSADCFDIGVSAVKIATQFMTPVMVLSDTYLVNAAEPWLLPDVNEIEPFPVSFRTDPEGFQPFLRDPKTGARPWVKPGTPGLMHRIGGLERASESGNVSYDPANHQNMTDARREKVQGISNFLPKQEIDSGANKGKVVVVGWGSTYGPISQAVGRAINQGHAVSHIHLRNIWPLPSNLGELFSGFEKVLVPELNAGQLLTVLRAEYLVNANGLNKVAGQPFRVSEIESAIISMVEEKNE